MQECKRDTEVYNSLLDSGRGRGWDDLGEWRGNMYDIICQMNHQSRFYA